jgi:calcineurin-like phosphoesterase family protein
MDARWSRTNRRGTFAFSARNSRDHSAGSGHPGQAMTTWFTADLHLGHTNIIGYSARPFVDVEAMSRALVERWNDTVDSADDVWILGDFALGKIVDTLPLAAELHGRKMLLAGNHDRCWAEHGRRANGWAERYLDAGFAEIRQGQINIDIGGVKTLACHFPYRGDSHDNDRYAEQRPADRGAWLLHGHVHERWQQRGRMINVGVDAWGYRPVSAARLGEVIDGGPMDRAPAGR